MAGLPEVPNLDPNAPPAPPDPPPAKIVVTAAAKASTDPGVRIKPAPGEPPPGQADKGAAAKAVPAGARRPSVPPAPPPEAANAPGSEVQESVEEVLQHTSAQTLKLSHLEDVLAALNNTLGDLQDEMHAGFSELRAVLESSISSVVATRNTEVKEKAPLAQNVEALEEHQLAIKKSQTLLLAVGILQALLLVVTLVAVITSRPEPVRREVIEPTPTPSVAPAAASPIGDIDEPTPLPGEDTKHKGVKKKKKGIH